MSKAQSVELVDKLVQDFIDIAGYTEAEAREAAFKVRQRDHISF